MTADRPLADIASLWIEGPLSWMERASIQSFLDLGHRYTLYSYGEVPNVPEGAVHRDAREIWAQDEIVVHAKAKSPAIHADVFRAIMTCKTRQVWADTDIIAVRPFALAGGWYLGYERGAKLGNAIMGFPEGSETARLLSEFLSSENMVPPWFNSGGQKQLRKMLENGQTIRLGDLPWGSTGPQALSYYAELTGEISHAQPVATFFPVDFGARKMLVDPKQADRVAAFEADERCLSIHLYSRWLRKYTEGRFPKQGSWLGDKLVQLGIAEADQLASAEKKKKAKAPKAKPVPIDPEAFFADLDARKDAVPGGANTSPHGRIVAVTMAKDEGPYVLEWVAYHHLLGFTDLLAFTNDCTDGTDEMLDALAKLGLVTRIDNPPLGTKPPQSRALRRAQVHPLVGAADWVMVFDFDEFVSIKAGEGRVDDAIDIIKDRGATGMAMTWRFFGSGGVPRYSDRLVTERFTNAAGDDFVKGFGVKTLFSHQPGIKLAIHRPNIAGKSDSERVVFNWVNGSGNPVDGRVMTWRQTRNTAGYDFAQVNHYGVKSGEEFLMRRLRGDVLNNHGKYDDAYFQQFDRNETTDRSAADRGRKVKAFIAKLLKDPDVAAAQKLVESRYAEKLERLRTSDGYDDQMRSLREVADQPLASATSS